MINWLQNKIMTAFFSKLAMQWVMFSICLLTTISDPIDLKNCTYHERTLHKAEFDYVFFMVRLMTLEQWWIKVYDKGLLHMNMFNSFPLFDGSPYKFWILQLNCIVIEVAILYNYYSNFMHQFETADKFSIMIYKNPGMKWSGKTFFVAMTLTFYNL